MSDPVTIAQVIADNLKADVTAAAGAPKDLAHAYNGKRKNYDWRKGPFAIVHLMDEPSDETQYTEAARRRIKYAARVDLVWVRPDAEDAASDRTVGEQEMLALVESAKASLRKHTSLGGRVLKCANDAISAVIRYDPQQVPHWEAELRFGVLDQINAAPIG